MPAASAVIAPSAAISCRGLVKRYGTVVAVDGLDLEVRAGACFGLLGPNGAGKTTTIEILQGLLAPDAGEVLVLGLGWRGGMKGGSSLWGPRLVVARTKARGVWWSSRGRPSPRRSTRRCSPSPA